MGWGCGQKLGLFSRHKAEAFTVLDWASFTKGHLDARFVIPMDVGTNLVNKLGHGEDSPVTRIEELNFSAFPSPTAFGPSCWPVRSPPACGAYVEEWNVGKSLGLFLCGLPTE